MAQKKDDKGDAPAKPAVDAPSDAGTDAPVDAPSDAGADAPSAAPLDAPAARADNGPLQPGATPPPAPLEAGAVVGEDGQPLAADALFTDPGMHQTFVLSTQRIYEDYPIPGTREKGRRLLLPEGAQVPRSTAEQIRRRTST